MAYEIKDLPGTVASASTSCSATIACVRPLPMEHDYNEVSRVAGQVRSPVMVRRKIYREQLLRWGTPSKMKGTVVQIGTEQLVRWGSREQLFK